MKKDIYGYTLVSNNKSRAIFKNRDGVILIHSKKKDLEYNKTYWKAIKVKILPS